MPPQSNGVPRLTRTARPLVYEINARVLVNELSNVAGKRITLATIPDPILDEWASLGFDAVWLMGVWTTGAIGLQMALHHEGLLKDYSRVLQDFTTADVIGSPYAVKSYTVSRVLGGNEALLTLRKRLQKRGLGLILDFVVNHTARDHRWVSQHPEYYINGVDGDDVNQPGLYFATKTAKGKRVLAFGKDPHFPGWTDTAQLNHCLSDTRSAVIKDLQKIAGLCDGIRCDMAMLVVQDVFQRTWGDRALPEKLEPADGEFWSEAVSTVRKKNPGFIFMAEAYWNLEWQLQQLGFNYTYDKTLYDRLLKEGASSVYDHLKAEMDYQKKSVRFIENHDEVRAAHALPSEAWNSAAATVMATVPGMALFHEGQLDGRKIKLPVQLGRRPTEQVSGPLRTFYTRLLACVVHPVFQQGTWKLLGAKPAWHENHSWQNFLAFWWHEKSSGARMIVVNYAPHNGQCYIQLELEGVEGRQVEFRDLLGTAVHVRERSALTTKGMYFDLPGYAIHLFDVQSSRKSPL